MSPFNLPVVLGSVADMVMLIKLPEPNIELAAIVLISVPETAAPTTPLLGF